MQYGYFVLVMITENHNLFSLSWLTVLPEHLRSPLGFSGIFRFLCRSLSFCHFFFGQCVDCTSSIYGFWLPFWYLQTYFLSCVLLLLFQTSQLFVEWYDTINSQETTQNSF